MDRSPIIACVLIAGCASTYPPSRPVVEFPRPEALAAIEGAPAPTPKVNDAPMPAEGWTVDLGDRPATAHEPWVPSSALDRVVADALARRPGKPPQLREAMTCVARELGRYLIDQKVAPPVRLRTFVLGACGAVATSVGWTSVTGTAPPSTTADALAPAWRKLLEEMVGGLSGNPTDAGFALVRKGNDLLGVLAYAQVRVRFEPFTPVASESNDLTLEGELDGPADRIVAYVNHGRHAAATCFVDPAVARPRFRIMCEVQPSDETTRVQVLYAPPRRALATPVAEVLVRRAGARAVSYRHVPYASPQPAASAADFAPRAVDRLNQVRGEAGLKAVKLAAAQTAAATRVAPHYLAGVLGNGKPEDVDTIVLGLLAGWQVKSGMIRDASFISTVVSGAHDVGLWLDSTLESPHGRVALLDPSIDELALGPMLLSSPDAAGAMVVGYRFHRGSDHTRDVQRLLGRSVVARKRRALPPPARLAGMDEVMRSELAEVHAGKQSPSEALQAVLDWGAARFGNHTRGYVVEATSLDSVEIPEDVLAQPTLHLDFGVTHHRPPGAAWGQLVILVVHINYGGRPPLPARLAARAGARGR